MDTGEISIAAGESRSSPVSGAIFPVLPNIACLTHTIRGDGALESEISKIDFSIAASPAMPDGWTKSGRHDANPGNWCNSSWMLTKFGRVSVLHQPAANDTCTPSAAWVSSAVVEINPNIACRMLLHLNRCLDYVLDSSSYGLTDFELALSES